MGELRQAKFFAPQEYPLYLEEGLEKPANVQKYWENELIQFAIKPFLKELLAKRENIKFRCLELGNVVGQGYELLTNILQNQNDLHQEKSYLLTEEMMDLYLGLGTEYDSIEQANYLHRTQKKVRFIKTDLRKGLGLFKEEPAFDVYFSSFGGLSTLSTQELSVLVKDILLHARHESLVVLDVMGKNALLKKSILQKGEYCFWTGKELKHFVKEIALSEGIGVELLKYLDYSILISEPASNWQYGIWFKNIRQSINSLFEPFVRTDLNKLLLNEQVFPEFADERVTQFWQHLLFHWNLFVWYAIERMKEEIDPKQIENWACFTPQLQFALLTLDRLIHDTRWIAYGDTRANIIEPHIGYVLRSFEYELQKGLGCGQNLSLIFKVKK